MASRFVDAGCVEDFISEQENKSTAKKTLRDVKLLQLFLVNKNEERNIKDIRIEELNEYVSSLRNLLASFKQHLKKDSDDDF